MRGFKVSGWEVDTDEVQFAIPRSTKELRSRGCGARDQQEPDRPRLRWVFPARARRAVSVLTWIACAVAPPYAGPRSPTPRRRHRDSGDTTRMARETMVREQIGGAG